jgi:rubrerythrin
VLRFLDILFGNHHVLGQTVYEYFIEKHMHQQAPTKIKAVNQIQILIIYTCASCGFINSMSTNEKRHTDLAVCRISI